MASSIRLRDRIFAGFGAALFLVSAVGVTALYIQTSRANEKADVAKTNTTDECSITSVASEAMAAPEVYKPEGAVTKLETTDLEVGTGATAKSGDCLVMKYQGSLATDGKVFDENFTKTTALQFKLGAGQVIEGWDQGLEGMKVGGTRRVLIPYSLGYKEAGYPPDIPGSADLVFTVKLVDIKN